MADLTGILPAALTIQQEAAAQAAVARAYSGWIDTRADTAGWPPATPGEYGSFSTLIDADTSALTGLAGDIARELGRVQLGSTLAEAAVKHTGAMVALYPTPRVARSLAVEGGEPVRDIHLTLAFLGDAADQRDPAALADIVRGWAASTPILTGVVSGTGKFTAGPDPVTYVSPDLPGLPAARQRLVDALIAGGYEPSQDHGYSPHMTVGYDDLDIEPRNLKLRFPRATLVLADRRQHFDFKGATTTDG